MIKKKWKTYFGKCIYSFNDELKIYDNYLYRWLTFNSPYIQTLICKFKLHKPELQYMQPLTLAVRYSRGPTCLLGLGGGALAHYLNYSNIQLTIIENNAQVISIAKQYFMLNQLSNVQLIHMDAIDFLQYSIRPLRSLAVESNCEKTSTQEKYSHLLIDIHDAYNFPQNCLNIDFFEKCKNILKKNGVLAINICNNHEFKIIYKYLLSIFNNKVLSIQIPFFTNTILLASEKYTFNEIINSFANNPEIEKIEWDSEFGYVLKYKF